MRLDLRATGALMASLPVVGFCMAEERAQLFFSLGIAAIAMLLKLETKFRLSAASWNLLSAGSLVLFLVEWLLLHRSALFASTHLLLYLLVNKLHTSSTVRDHEQLLMVSFLALLATTVLAVEAVVGLFMLVWLVAASAHLRALALARIEPSTGPLTSGVPIGAAVRSAALVLVGSTVLFAVVPRVGAGTLQLGALSSNIVSGFSPRVDLNDVSRIKSSDAVVLRIRRIDGPAPSGPIYLRGVAFDRWDGRRWSRRTGFRLVRNPGRGRVPSLPPLARDEPTRFEISLEPTSTPVLFAPSRPVDIEFEDGAEPLYSDFAGALYFETAPVGRRRYIASSDLFGSAAPMLRHALEPEEFTQLPAVDPRLEQLARRLADPADPPRVAARKIEEHLRSAYGYTLDLSITPQQDPLAELLFVRRAGHCELFASSMTVMLRQLEIPARVVTGFVASWDLEQDYVVVRARDAHAWVEVFVSGEGWVIFDPTPASEGGDAARSSWLSFRGLQQRLALAWDRWVISFSGVDQRSALLWAQENLLGLALVVSAAGVSKRLAWIGGLLLVGMVLVTLVVWWRRRRRSLEPAHRGYLEMLKLLARAGVPKPASQTPSEFAAQLRERLPQVGELTALYEADRFAFRRLDDASIRRLRELLVSLSKEVRQRR